MLSTRLLLKKQVFHRELYTNVLTESWVEDRERKKKPGAKTCTIIVKNCKPEKMWQLLRGSLWSFRIFNFHNVQTHWSLVSGYFGEVDADFRYQFYILLQPSPYQHCHNFIGLMSMMLLWLSTKLGWHKPHGEYIKDCKWQRYETKKQQCKEIKDKWLYRKLQQRNQLWSSSWNSTQKEAPAKWIYQHPSQKDDMSAVEKKRLFFKQYSHFWTDLCQIHVNLHSARLLS